MEPGAASIERSTVDEVMGVINAIVARDQRVAMYLYFRAGGNGEAICVDHSNSAHRCPRCATLVLGPPSPPEPTDATEAIECLSCGRTIPPGATACSCGWTWGEDGTS
jgi:ribosomal protein S27E